MLFAAVVVYLALVGGKLHAQSFDATGVRGPVEIGSNGVVQTGDDPAWSRPEFDDSKWHPVDATTPLSAYFPGRRAAVVWRRLHVQVSPQQAGLAIEAYNISRAFEVYVNGHKLIASGQVEPFVPYTRNARIIVRIPPQELRSGSLTIAIRASAPRTWWSSLEPAFPGTDLTLGDEGALRNQNLLSMIGDYSAVFAENLLSLGVGLVALALFLGQRQRKEYFWIFVQGVLNFAILPVIYLSAVRNISAQLWMINELINFSFFMALLLMVQAFLRKPFAALVWLGAIALLPNLLGDVLYFYGVAPVIYQSVFPIPLSIVFCLIVPFLLLRELRRGDREAGILFIPFLLFSLYSYANIVLGVLAFVPALHRVTTSAWQFINQIHLGMFTVGLGDVGTVSFYLSLGIIITLRSSRMSRQQAMLENEMAAAAEVQRIILPDQGETIPGFAIESVYQPAEQVGGDFFQVMPSPGGGLFLVVGDVAGKGLPAAMLVSVLVGAIRTVAAYSQSPTEVLAQLNERLVGRTRGGFSTALAAHIAPGGLVTIANAGHLSPYLDGREIELPGAVPLGIVSDNVYESIQFDLAHGSRLTFYSDGVVEAQNPKGELFGFDRAKAISTQSAAVIVAAAKQFGQSDDITVVTIEHLVPLEQPFAVSTSPQLAQA